MKKHITFSILLATFFAGCMSSGNRDAGAYGDLHLETADQYDGDLVNRVYDSSNKTSGNYIHPAVMKFTKAYNGKDKIRIGVPGVDPSSGKLGHVSLHFEVGRTTQTYLGDAAPKETEKRQSLEDMQLKVVCVYRSYLIAEENIALDLQIYGSATNGSYGLRNRTLITQTSDPIILKKGQQPSALVDTCESMFQSKYREEAIGLLKGHATNMAYKLPRKSCQVPSPPRSRTGDRECMEWYRSLFASRAKHTIPRCLAEEGLGGKRGFCVVRARTHRQCPLFVDRDRGFTQDPNSLVVRLATDPLTIQFFCDQSMNESCETESHPTGGSGSVKAFCRAH